MDTTLSHAIPEKKPVNAKVWTGRVISGLCILFFLFDAIGKIMLESHSVAGSIALGWPETSIRNVGVTLLICTIFYCIPRTAIIGAVLLTGFLGGAIAIMVRAGQPLYFAAAFGVLVWAGLYLRNEQLRTLFS